MSRDFGLPQFLYLLNAVPWTLLLSLGAFVGGGLVGLAVALLRVSALKPARWFAIGFIEVFQCTPVLMQLFIAYYGLPVLLDIRIDPWLAVLSVFTLYSAAFLGDIWRGCIQAIPRGQWEAAACLPLTYAQQLRHVVLPQAARISIPPTVGFAVQLIKNTSVAAIIGFVELTRAGQLMTNTTFKPMIVYPIVAVLYFALCWPLSKLADTLERRIDAGLGTQKRL